MVRFEWYSTELRCHYQVKADDLGFPGDDMIMRVHRGVCVFLSSVLLFNQRPTIVPLYNNSLVPLSTAGTPCRVASQVTQTQV